MKTKRFLACVLCLAMLISMFTFTLPVAAEDTVYSGECGAQGDNVKWSFDPNTGKLTVSGEGAMKSYTSLNAPWYSYRSLIEDIVITSGITTIGDHAFNYCTNLSTVELPQTVLSIGSYAFSGCSGLTNVKLPNSLISINQSAFHSCVNLPNIVIPDNVTNIGWYVFYNCQSLTSIEIPSKVTSIGSHMLSGCINLTSIIVDKNNSVYHSDTNCLIQTKSKILVSGCKTSIIPTDGSVTSIGKYAFYDCKYLSNIEIPSCVTNIDLSAFYDCSSITSITIPDSVTSIGSGAFSGCTNLSDIAMSKNITNIGSAAFSNCEKLAEIEIPNGVTAINNSTFNGCKNLKYINIPDSIISIGEYAFYECDNLTSIEIPSSITSIKTWAFYGCYRLKSVYITDVSSWMNISFDRYDSNPCYYGASIYVNNVLLKDIVIPNDINTINNWTFYNYKPITNIKIPDNIINIGEGAFQSCTNITTVELCSEVQSIGNNAFAFCNNLSKFKASEGVISIGNAAFQNCKNLTDIDLGEKTEYIGNNVFQGCSKLTDISLPDSLISIGEYAFSNCTNLETIKIGHNLTSIKQGVFWQNSALKCIFIDSSEIVKNATSSSLGGAQQYALSFVINKSITEIGSVITENYKYVEEIKYDNVDYICYSNHNHMWQNTSQDESCCIKKTCTICCLQCEESFDSHNYNITGKDENNHWTECSNCGHKKDISTHSWNNGEIIKDPSHLALGEKKLTCAVCGETYVEQVPKLTEHTYRNCEQYNETQHQKTCECGDVKYASHIYDNADDRFCDECGYVRHAVGDIDGNGHINKDDATYLLMHIFFPWDFPSNQPVDFDKNDKLNKDDAIYLLMYTFFPDDYPIA